MITKITSRLAPIAKQPVRANLQKTAITGLAILAGSSMSGWHDPIPRYIHKEPTEMIIPNGLTLKEKAYFVLKGELPPSVYDRLIPLDENYIPNNKDQVVTINILDNGYMGKVVEAPHYINSPTEHLEPLNIDISQDLRLDTHQGIVSGVTDDSSGNESNNDVETSWIDDLRRALGEY